MRFPKRTPGKAGGSQLSWTHEQFKGGGVLNGWFGSGVVWVLVHHRGVSKPCHSELTGGALKCPYCGVITVMHELGYMPWFGDSGKPLMTVVKDYARPVVSGLKQFDPIRVRKGEAKTSAVAVDRSKWSEPFRPTLGMERTGEQFERWLVKLWGEQALIEWFAQADQQQPEKKPAAPLREHELVRRDAELEYQRFLRGERDEPPPEQCEQIADVIPLLQRMYGGKPSGNGQH